ncbi:helix-turn-helix domain-containing protein [Saccharibacillus sp. CPCC 101409]|uniref:TetR/AcrR family transcriptional regulator n=1 Tax=Saccharibacillus sp. CPCC 101409 TaxID=3058041 RepID=UPI002672327C|nr:TetR/AcrR family transcriptional regulator [Saccharibacillus sp. CPCC 101409]MDO3411630.1 helix-turn-helix domain-containing protein [Saccharibacillus sp. CPCC 101409]
MARKAASPNRKEEIVSAAVEVFAETGYYRATTAQVAGRAGISQPYVFRFFATKEDLLAEALNVSWTRTFDAFRGVIESAETPKLEEELIGAYTELMERHRSEILLQMQAQTIAEPRIAGIMREGFRETRKLVQDAFVRAGIDNPKHRTLIFLARGMLCNTSMALDLPELMEEEDV